MYINVADSCAFRCLNCTHLENDKKNGWKRCQKPESKIEKKADKKVYCSEYSKIKEE